MLYYVGSYTDAMDLYYEAYKRTLSLLPSNIQLRIENPKTSGTTTFYYRIVLMKIN